MDDLTLARMIADTVGKKLLKVRTGYEGHDNIGVIGDQEAQKVIAQILAKYRPDDAVLSEEATDTGERLNAKRVWIVDPLDGTKEFATHNRDDWAVHIALWERQGFQLGLVKVAVVALPALNQVFDTATAAAPPEPTGRLRIIVSRSRPPAFITKLATSLDAEVIQMGSAGAKTCAVLRGEADVYLHTGGQHEWDSAAPVGVAMSAGLHASRVTGAPILYNQADPRVPDFIICAKVVADPVLRFIERAM